jgi:hypothetical protein
MNFILQLDRMRKRAVAFRAKARRTVKDLDGLIKTIDAHKRRIRRQNKRGISN